MNNPLTSYITVLLILILPPILFHHRQQFIKLLNPV